MNAISFTLRHPVAALLASIGLGTVAGGIFGFVLWVLDEGDE